MSFSKIEGMTYLCALGSTDEPTITEVQVIRPYTAIGSISLPRTYQDIIAAKGDQTWEWEDDSFKGLTKALRTLGLKPQWLSDEDEMNYGFHLYGNDWGIRFYTHMDSLEQNPDPDKDVVRISFYRYIDELVDNNHYRSTQSELDLPEGKPVLIRFAVNESGFHLEMYYEGMLVTGLVAPCETTDSKT